MNILTKYTTCINSPDFFFFKQGFLSLIHRSKTKLLKKTESEILSSKSIFQNLESISFYSAR